MCTMLLTDANIHMIRSILCDSNIQIDRVASSTITKIHNPSFEILVKNNKSIVVVDKRNPCQDTIYKNLRLAFNILQHQFQRSDESYQIQSYSDSMAQQQIGQLEHQTVVDS